MINTVMKARNLLLLMFLALHLARRENQENESENFRGLKKEIAWQCIIAALISSDITIVHDGICV